MIKEHDRVVLTTDLPAEKLGAGDVGTVVHVYRDGLAYEAEFFTLDGSAAAVAAVEGAQVRPVSKRDISHVRELQPVWGPSINNLHNLTGSFDGWQRCSLVTEPFGQASRPRLASRQNSGVRL
jgi:hypothetical protein